MSPQTVPELKTAVPHRGMDAHGPLIVALITGAGMGLWAGAQYVAHQLAYHPNLGPALYALPPELRGYVLAAAVLCAGGSLAALAGRGTRRFGLLLAVAAAGLLAIRLGPLYSPFRFVRWSVVYRAIPELAPIVSTGILLPV
jgi:hypothetical protein